MISRDSFDGIEAQLRDRYRFMQWALAAFSVALTLLLERGLDLYLAEKDEHAVIVMLFAVPFVIFGVIFLCLHRGKNTEYNSTKVRIFDKGNIISDKTEIIATDGSTHTIDHLAP